jgi:hypothetical protein
VSLDYAARHYPLKFLEVLARRIGLDYEKISKHMEWLEEHRQGLINQSAKRGQQESISAEQNQASKRVHGTPRSEQQLQVRSQGSTDVIPETDLQEHSEQSLISTHILTSSGENTGSEST